MTAGMAQAEDFSSLTLEEEPEVVTQQHAPKTSFFFFFLTQPELEDIVATERSWQGSDG